MGGDEIYARGIVMGWEFDGDGNARRKGYIMTLTRGCFAPYVSEAGGRVGQGRGEGGRVRVVPKGNINVA